ncbi:2-hydroxy-3-oxopropionate reductase [Reticulibacter mediterranei]|uniref:2-hydroxy-3-oxopropionate reductase n=1 Tax=Reticulibacter mediterranei TaxID=2778369 RepID=A0A8J3IS63_9CHLR|nr:2-hydroxy-3-oxopropionate reductase [Reticulibacter mediterranei]GHO96904.1 2-hydroxy-3-oxopropionate reductase [Reticulibacter mediterranei]
MGEHIGFIGLGLMGKPMSHNLLKAGYSLSVFNRSAPAVNELVQAGASAATSPREIAERCDIVITMLPDTPDVESVFTGSDGLLAGSHADLLLIDMSTIAPATAQRLAAEALRHDVHVLDAPVSGGDVGARAGTLSIMVGGTQEDLERARPVFEVLGQRITHCGPHGSGQIVKACNQVVVALIIEAVSEALVLGAKAGVQPDVILQVLGGGLAQNRVMDLRGASMIQHQFSPGGKARFHHKDLGIALQLARASGVAVPMTAFVDQLFLGLSEQGKGDLDHSALLTMLELLSNYSLANE